MSTSQPMPVATQRKRIMLVLFVGVFMAALDTAIIAPAIPTLRAAFGIDNSQVALVTIVYVLFSLCSTAPMASLSDRYGRRRMYLLNVGLFTLGSLTVALAPNFTILLLGRALQGTGSGGVTPTASAVIGDTFPVEQRGKALGLIGATFGMAFLIGPVLASLILVALSWHWLFLLNLPVALLIFVLGLRYLPTSRADAVRPPFDWAGTLILFVTLVALTLGINQVADRYVGMPIWPYMLGLALLGLLLLLRVERRAARPIVPLNVFNSRQLALSYVLAIGAGFGMGSVFFITSIAVAAFATPEQQAGFLLLPLVLCSSVGSVMAGRLLNSLGSRTIMLAGFGSLGLGSLLLGLVPAVFWLFLLATMLIGLGVGIVAGGTLRYIMLNEVTPDNRTAAQGLISICISIGNLLVVATLGTIADSRGAGLAGLELAYLTASSFILLLFLLTFGLKSRQAEQQSLPSYEVAPGSA